MAQSLRNIYLHVTFACKFRACLIEESWREHLHDYLRHTATGEGHKIETLYAMPDHCHILLRLGPTQSYADAIRALKANSSRWIREDLNQLQFNWQNGYAAYSVSISHLSKVKSYIERQPIIHKRRTFSKELDQILAISGEKLNEQERYRWVNGI